MKKKGIIAVLDICIMLGLSACGKAAQPAASDLTTGRGESRTEGGGNAAGKEGVDDAGAAEDTENAETAKDKETPEKTDREKALKTGAFTDKTGVVFGSGEAVGYKDFKYLTENFVSTSKTESKKEAVFSAYIPKEDKSRVTGATAKSKLAGVSVKVDLEPNLQYKAETYSVQENLENYIHGEVAYYGDSDLDYYVVDVGDVEEIEEGIAACEMSYCKLDSSYYDSYYEETSYEEEDSSSYYYVIYGMYDLGDRVQALVTVTIDVDNIEDETDAVLEELCSFYQLPNQWDENYFKIRSAIFENTGEAIDGVFYTEYLSFELPEGWKKDEELSDDYGDIAFAPKGDAEKAGCFISVSSIDETGFLDFFMEMEEDDWIDEYYEEEKLTVEEMGETLLGRTIMLTAYIFEDEMTGYTLMYVAEDDVNTYIIIGFTAYDEEDMDGELEASKELLKAMDRFWETVQTTGY